LSSMSCTCILYGVYRLNYKWKCNGFVSVITLGKIYRVEHFMIKYSESQWHSFSDPLRGKLQLHVTRQDCNPQWKSKTAAQKSLPRVADQAKAAIEFPYSTIFLLFT
jgi:hypothetical protein